MSTPEPQNAQRQEDADPFRCVCAPPNGRCVNRMTQEDGLCDDCRVSEFCAIVAGVVR